MGIKDFFRKKPKIKYNIVADWIKPPVLLEGTEIQIHVLSGDHYTKILTMLIGAKGNGWHGGNDFFIVEGTDAVVKSLDQGMKIKGEDAIELSDIIKNNYKVWQDDPEIKSFVKLCENGGFIIKFLP